MSVKVIFMDRWHNPIRAKDNELKPDKVIAIPPGAIFLKLEPEKK